MASIRRRELKTSSSFTHRFCSKSDDEQGERGLHTSSTTETAIVEKPAEEADDGHGHGHHHGQRTE
jgi:hypothetical protein